MLTIGIYRFIIGSIINAMIRNSSMIETIRERSKSWKWSLVNMIWMRLWASTSKM